MIFINLTLGISVILRLLALKMTLKALGSGDYEEMNPISRLMLKKPLIIYIFNIAGFTWLFYLFNTVFLTVPELNLFVHVMVLVSFLIVFIDFLWDIREVRK